MTYEEAVERLRAAGLYVRPMDRGDIVGGSHVDASNPLIRMVQNGFALLREGDDYRVKTHLDGQGEGIGGLTLEAAVELVAKTIQPQPNIEAEPAPIPSGPTLY